MRRRHRRPQRPDHQPDLFRESPPQASGPAPGWSALPEQTRHTLIGLMTRLLMAHTNGTAHEPGSDADER